MPKIKQIASGELVQQLPAAPAFQSADDRALDDLARAWKTPALETVPSKKPVETTKSEPFLLTTPAHPRVDIILGDGAFARTVQRVQDVIDGRRSTIESWKSSRRFSDTGLLAEVDALTAKSVDAIFTITSDLIDRAQLIADRVPAALFSTEKPDNELPSDIAAALAVRQAEVRSTVKAMPLDERIAFLFTLAKNPNESDAREVLRAILNAGAIGLLALPAYAATYLRAYALAWSNAPMALDALAARSAIRDVESIRQRAFEFIGGAALQNLRMVAGSTL